MQASLRIKTENSFPRFQPHSNTENNDFLIDLISPWNDSLSKGNQMNQSAYSPFNYSRRNTDIFDGGKTQTLKRIRVKNSRIKTEQSHKFSLKKMQKFSGKIQDFSNNFFAINFVREKTESSQLNLKRSRQIKSREKFRTPVININEHSFTDKFKDQFASITPPSLLRQKQVIKNNKTFGFRPSFKENTYFSMTKNMKPAIKKISTQKVIPLYNKCTTPLNKERQSVFNKTYAGSIGGKNSLAENLKRIMNSQMEPVIKRIKSKSMNKFNKTFY